MSKDRSALALLFDAMMFLTIISVISVVLIGLTGDWGRHDDGRQEYVNDVHETILSVTCEWCRGMNSTPLTVSDVVSIGLDEEHEVMLVEQLEKLMDGYLGQQYRYHLTFRTATVLIEVGEMIDGQPDTVMVSTIGAGTDVTSTLSVW